MTACQEVMDTCLESEGPTSLEVESEAKHEEVPQEEAAMETVRPLKKRHGDWHLVVRHCSWPKNGLTAMVDPRRSWPLPKDS
jgi:hypothetical protein